MTSRMNAWEACKDPSKRQSRALIDFIGFATSEDGLKWIKPKLGLIEHKGTKDNNLCRPEPFGKPIPGRLHFIPDTRSRSAERKFQAIGIFPYHEDGTYYTGWKS